MTETRLGARGGCGGAALRDSTTPQLTRFTRTSKNFRRVVINVSFWRNGGKWKQLQSG